MVIKLLATAILTLIRNRPLVPVTRFLSSPVYTTIYRDCSRHLYKFKYTVPSDYQDAAKNGGAGDMKLDNLPLNFDVTKLDINPETSSVGVSNVKAPFEEVIDLFGPGISYRSLSYSAELDIPCPNRKITGPELDQLVAAPYRVYKDGSYLHLTEKGLFYWQLQAPPDPQFFVYYYEPGSERYVLFTPEEHAWLQPGDVFDVLVRDVVVPLAKGATDPHIILGIIGASEIVGLSQIADLVDAALYFYEDNPGEGILALAGTIPGVKSLIVAGRSGVRLPKLLRQYTNSASAFVDFSTQAKAIESYSFSLGLDEIQAGKLASLFRESRIFTKAALANRKYIDAWKVFDDAGIALRLDDPELLDDFDKLTELVTDLDDYAFAAYLTKHADEVRAWEKMLTVSATVRKAPNSLKTTSRLIESGLEFTVESIDDVGAALKGSDGKEIGQIIKDGADEYFEFSDDLFTSTSAGPATPLSGISYRANTGKGEKFINPGVIVKSDGTAGFVEDVTSYGHDLVQSAIKNRGDLRGDMTGILSTQEAHHLIPIQLLKQNPVVKSAVEGGFNFNTALENGLPLEKFVKITGQGRHGPHPRYTRQITKVFDDLALTGIIPDKDQAAKLLRNLCNGNSKYPGLRQVILNTDALGPPLYKLNEIDLGLADINVLDLLVD